MTPLRAAIVHINPSLPMEIDENQLIDCTWGACTDEKWRAHILSFSLETPVCPGHRGLEKQYSPAGLITRFLQAQPGPG